MNKLAVLRHLMLRPSSSLLFQNGRSFSNTKAVLAGGFTKDFKPGPYPKNEEERIAAAKKYNLLPQDYEPYPDDGMGFGDYPKLPDLSVDMKSDWEEYDDPVTKRNFGEPVHILAEQITGDKVSLKPLFFSFPKIIFLFLLGSTTFLGTFYLLNDYKAFIPIAPKHYPRDRESGEQKHYRI